VRKSIKEVAETSTRVAELQSRVEAAIAVTTQSFERIVAGTADRRWFPHGISKVCVKLNIAEFQFEVEVSGPPGEATATIYGGTIMSDVPCTVTVSNGAVACNPETLTVSRSQKQDGIKWTFANSGYTFTGLTIDDVPAPTGDFGAPEIDSNSAGRSTMRVSDSVQNLKFYSYKLQYLDDKGQPGESPVKVEGGITTPQIKNQN
jgi:hypothetical protein